MPDDKGTARLVAIVGLVVALSACAACFLVVLIFSSTYGGETIALRNPFAPAVAQTQVVVNNNGSNTTQNNTSGNTTSSTGSDTLPNNGNTTQNNASGSPALNGSSQNSASSNTGNASAFLPAFNGYTNVGAQSVGDAFALLSGTGLFDAQAAGNDTTFSAQSLGAGTIATSIIVSRVDEFIECYRGVGAVDAQIYIKANINTFVNGDVPPLGAIAVINQDRLRDNLVSCAVSPNDPNAFSAQAAQPCGNFGTFRQAGETLYYIYAGTNTEFCNLVDTYYARFGG
jgi:hypothetical protein